MYEARVEVIVDNHYFVPVKFDAEFTEPVKVVAESLQPTVAKKAESSKKEIKIAAVSVSKAQFSSLRDKYLQTKK